MKIKDATVSMIVAQYLEEHGYEGLAGDYCGCKVGELFTCCDFDSASEKIPNCQPGHLTDCDPETCPAGGDCDWHITAGEKGA